MKLIKKSQLFIILIAFGLLFIVFFTDHHINSDALQRFESIRLLMEDHRLSDTSYSMIGPLFSIPLWLIGNLIKTPQWWLERYNFILLSMFISFFYYWGRKHLRKDTLIYSIIIFLSSSLFIPYQINYMGEMFTAIFAGIGILLLTSKKDFGWILLIIGTANTPATLVGFGFITLYMIWKEKRLHYAIYPVLALTLVLLESYLRRGSVFSSGYEGNMGFRTILPYSGLPGFSYPFLLGLISILFSFGKGLVFFFPGLWFIPELKNLKSKRSVFDLVLLSLLFLLGEIIIYSKWWSWYGGLYWGPRFFLIGSIAASILLASMISNAKTKSFLTKMFIFTAILLGGWVVISGTVFDLKNLSACSENDFTTEFLCWYVPEFSPLFRPFIEPSALSVNNILLIVAVLTSVVYMCFPILFYSLKDLKCCVKLMISKLKLFKF